MSALHTRPVIAAVRERQPYVNSTGSVRCISRTERRPLPFRGQLHPSWLTSVEAASFVVFSYSTPIAWWSDDDGWTVPDVRYSPTTTRHQNAVRSGIREWLLTSDGQARAGRPLTVV